MQMHSYPSVSVLIIDPINPNGSTILKDTFKSALLTSEMVSHVSSSSHTLLSSMVIDNKIHHNRTSGDLSVFCVKAASI